MRRQRVVRFLVIAFAAGAFLGLISGLLVGGRPGSQAHSATTPPAVSRPVGASSTSTLATAAQPMTVEPAQAIGANEMGKIPVLEYHIIGTPEDTYNRSPEHFREDIALLESQGYYPINLRDPASGNIDIPAGKSPVALTFDDSSEGQYCILDDGTWTPTARSASCRRQPSRGIGRRELPSSL